MQPLTTYVFTSVNAAYLPKARVLASSIKRHHSDFKFVLLLAENDVPPSVAADELFDHVIALPELHIPKLKSWVFKHTVVELCTAIKPFCLEILLNRDDCAQAIYLDPDIVVFSPLTSVLNGLQQASIVLTPHLLDPEERDDAIAENELSALKHGVYNLGFVAVRSSDEGKRFAAWWKNRLYQFCYDDIPSGVFTDQRWIDLVPAFFEDHLILRDRACNVAPWNTTRRTISGTIPDDVKVNGEAVKFYHFTGLDSGAHEEMLEHFGEENRVLFKLRNWYVAQCDAMQQSVASDVPTRWEFDYYSNGEKITKPHRKFLRDHSYLEDVFPDPFNTEGTSFLAWYNQQQKTDSVPFMSKIGQLLRR